MKKHKVAIYIRVSTKKQVEEGYSLDAQRERLVKICELNGYVIYKIYADEGKSAKDTKRPAYQEMMKDMKEGKFDRILVMKLDRIFRSTVDLEFGILEMQEYNVHFESASEQLDTSSSVGMLFVRTMGNLAQFERERISERVSDAFEEMIASGKAISGSQPLGYKIEDGKVVIDEDKREIIEYIFDTYEKNNSIRRTLLYTNEKFNLKLRYNSLRLLISNPLFYGCYRGNENYCTGYMTKERWERIQNIVNKKKLVKVYGSRFYLFSGLITDVNCGCKMSGNYKKNKHEDSISYRCPKFRHSKTCISKTVINEKWLESYLLENLNKYINNYFDSLEKEYSQSKVSYKDNSKKIAELKAEMKRTTISFNKGRMEEEEYDKEYDRLEKQLAKLQEAPVKKDTTALKDLSKMDWQGMYKELTQENKQAFWRGIIDKIELDPQNHKKGEEYIRVYFL